MNKVFVTYTSDGNNSQVVDKIFTTYNAALRYVVQQANPQLSGDALTQFCAEDDTKSYFTFYIHDVEVTA